jgi:hypothetical protein
MKDRAEQACRRLRLNDTTLVDLNLGAVDLGVAGVAKICEALADNTTCRGLTLVRNNLGVSGAEELGRFLARGHHTLASLYITGNRICDVGARAIANSLSNCALRELSISDNDIGEAGEGGAVVLCRSRVK